MEKLEIWDEALLLLKFPKNLYVNTQDEHYKFWCILPKDEGFITYWARIGTKIQSKYIKSNNIERDIHKKIRDKIAKGYTKLS